MKKGRVLVVDDTVVNIVIAVKILKKYPLHIETAKSGELAIEKIKNKNSYDIIFMDNMMPQMDGCEAARRIREMGFSGAIVAFSAEELERDDCFDAFLIKPINISAMNAVLNKFIFGENEICGVSVKKGLGLYDGNMEILLCAYRSYVKNVPVVMDKLRDVSEKNLRDYATYAHALRGNSASIGADEFSKKACELEEMAKRGDFEGVQKENASLLHDAEILLKNINEWLKINF